MVGFGTADTASCKILPRLPADLSCISPELGNDMASSGTTSPPFVKVLVMRKTKLAVPSKKLQRLCCRSCFFGARKKTADGIVLQGVAAHILGQPLDNLRLAESELPNDFDIVNRRQKHRKMRHT